MEVEPQQIDLDHAAKSDAEVDNTPEVAGGGFADTAEDRQRVREAQRAAGGCNGLVAILLDEPFTGIDVTTEDAIVALLRELRDEGRVILVSTHNLGSVPHFCDQVVLLNRTRQLASGLWWHAPVSCAGWTGLAR